MSLLKQRQYFGFRSSSTWMLLLLSLYFSWICPTEARVAELPGLGLVTTQRIPDVAVYSFSSINKTTTVAAAPFFPLIPAIEIVQPLGLQKQRENLLPPTNVVAQLQMHRPRNAFVSC